MSSIAFGARTGRANNYVGMVRATGNAALPNLGPGSHEAQPSIKVELPPPDAVSSAGFGSSAPRNFSGAPKTSVTVGPGSYNLADDADSFAGMAASYAHAQAQRGPMLGSPTVRGSLPAPREGPGSELDWGSNTTLARREAQRVAKGGSLYERPLPPSTQGAPPLGVDSNSVTVGASKAFTAPSKRAAPGPGEYAHLDPWKEDPHGHRPGALIAQPPVGLNEHGSFKGGKTMGSASAAVTWMRVPTAPSVPGKGTQHGFEEGDHGELVAVKAADKGYSGHLGDNPGPADYNPKPAIEKNAKVVGFGGYSKRPDWTKRPEPSVPVSSRSLDLAKGAGGFANGGAPQRPLSSGQARPTLVDGGGGGGEMGGRLVESAPMGMRHDHAERLPRSPVQPSSMFRKPEYKSKQASAEASPGPGSYDPPTFSLSLAPKAPETLQFFGSTQKRFGPAQTAELLVHPGPGAYKTAKSSFERTREVKHNPLRPADALPAFKSSAAQRAEHLAPPGCTQDIGPGEYEDVTAMGSNLARRRARERAANAQFLSSGPRFKETVGTDERAKPGPATYFNPGDDGEGPLGVVATAAMDPRSAVSLSYEASSQSDSLRDSLRQSLANSGARAQGPRHPRVGSPTFTRGRATRNSSAVALSVDQGTPAARAAALMRARNLGLLHGSIPSQHGSQPDRRARTAGPPRAGAGAAGADRAAATAGGLAEGSFSVARAHAGQGQDGQLRGSALRPRTTTAAGGRPGTAAFAALGRDGKVAKDPDEVKRIRLAAGGGQLGRQLGHAIDSEDRHTAPKQGVGPPLLFSSP